MRLRFILVPAFGLVIFLVFFKAEKPVYRQEPEYRSSKSKTSFQPKKPPKRIKKKHQENPPIKKKKSYRKNESATKELEKEPPTGFIKEESRLSTHKKPKQKRTSLDLLITTLPPWMRAYEKVQIHKANILLNELPIAQIRGRFSWPNQSFMEVEISDIGSEPSVELLNALGASINEINIDTKEEIYVLSKEYDLFDAAGSIQLLVKNRFLVEIQIENLPEKSLDQIIQHQIPFDKLFSLTRILHE